MIKNIINQPLLHFLLIGLGLFVLYNFTAGQNSEDTAPKTVIVDRDTLLTFMQYRSKAFNKEQFSDKLDNMQDQERQQLIEDFVREEVLYREALALGLEENDYVIRRRLIQKLDFINKGFIDGTISLTDEDVRKYYEQHKESYYVEPEVTFTHVYFNNETHGMDKAASLAEKELDTLNSNNVPFSDSVKYGDRFLYHINYVERTPEFVESHFGPEMAKSIFKLMPSESTWYGPFKSPYGYHLVKLADRKDGRYPDIDEVSATVEQDAKIDLSRDISEETVQKIIDGYDVRINIKRSESELFHSEKEKK